MLGAGPGRPIIVYDALNLCMSIRCRESVPPQVVVLGINVAGVIPITRKIDFDVVVLICKGNLCED